MATFQFYGTKDHPPMLWAVEKDSPAGWAVLESYNDGCTWIRNCTVAEEQDGWNFVAGWFASLYEGT